MKLNPLGIRLLVKPFQQETTTATGIFIPQKEDMPERGEVVAIGDLVEKIKVGDKVLFKKYSVDEVKIDAEKMLIIAESDIIAKVEV